MELLQNYTSATFLLILSRILISLILFSSSCTAQLRSFINCGSPDDVTVGDQTFVGDENPLQFRLSGDRGTVFKNSNQAQAAKPLCQSARVFKKPSLYEFDIPQSKVITYILRFHFCASSSYQQFGDAKFNVSANGHMLLPHFSIRNISNDSEIKEEFFLTISDHNKGKLQIYLVPDLGSPPLAFINAVEVLSTKQNINITDDSGSQVTAAGKGPSYSGQEFQVLETNYRINVGGPKVTDNNYWRTWVPDDPYLVNPDDARNSQSHTTDLTNDVSGQATDEDAPDKVYTTAKELISSPSKMPPNVTWQFKVSKGAKLFVRTHFCDIISPASGPYAFNLYIYDKFVQQIPPFKMFEQVAVPFFLDHMVDSDELGFLSISIGPVDDAGNRTYGFLNGLEIMELKSEIATEPAVLDHKSAPHVVLVIGLVCGSVILLVILVAVVLLCRRKKRATSVESVEWAMSSFYGGTNSRNMTPDRSSTQPSSVHNLQLRLKIPFGVIQQVTRNFDESLIIGEGGFGKVYKGTLKRGKKVAVKRSNPDHGQGLPEFQTEIMVLSQIRHRHLVSLVGYCYENGEMILVYEFMENGTLRDHLYGSSGRSTQPTLSWKQRLEICIGAAKGLDYLHTGSHTGIIHRDVKSTNILLDENYVAKVADFGLSRSGHLDKTHVSTDVKGTFGYLDPEYFTWMQLTEKSDVYSFGVVLLEVLSARPVIDISLPKEQVNLVDWAMTCLERGETQHIIDPLIAGEINPNSLKKFRETADKCLKENAVDRPPMSDVRWDLEYALQLQKTAAQREVQEDSMTDTSFNLPLPGVRRFLSQTLADEDEDLSLINTNTATGEVFSQLGFHHGNGR